MASDDVLEIPYEEPTQSGDAEPLGEYLLLPPPEDGMTIDEDEDGNVIYSFGEEETFEQESGGFYDNLAEVVPEHILQSIASDLIQKIEQDKTDREPGDKLYEEGIRRTGLGQDAPGGADFEGASRVVHPMLTEACIDYEARIIKEAWPTVGPVKPRIMGNVSKEKTERAKRKVDFMNWQLRDQIKEARGEVESMLTQVPLSGDGYLKLWYDPKLERPRVQFIPRDKCIIPKSAGGWYAAERRTVLDTISQVTMLSRIASGMYRDLRLPKVSIDPDPTKPEAANEKIEGVTSSGMNIDGDRDVYETMAYLEISPEMAQILSHEEEGRLYPYLITLDVTSKQILSIYRDWEENDKTLEPIDHVFEFPFIPWRGSHSIGLPHIIGGLSGAATGSLRALLDSAMVANAQGGFVIKGGAGDSAKTVQPRFGEFTQLDGGGPGGGNDIRQRVMQFNTKEPSGVLFQLLGFVVEAGKGAVRTSLDEMNVDGNPNVPVGTQLSRVEEGLVVFSAVHGRFHAAFDRFLSGLHRLNRMYLPDEPITIDADGKEIFVTREDFESQLDIAPVSDPTIYSDQQRMAQMQAILARSDQHPERYQGRNIEKRLLKLLRIDDVDDLLAPDNAPTEQNAVNENVAMALGKPVQVYPDQDHFSHIMTHLQFGASPAFGMNPLIAPKFLPAFLDHISQHIIFAYAKLANDLVNFAAGRNATDLVSPDSTVKAAFDKLLAVASGRVVPYAQNLYEQIAPQLQGAYAMLKQMQPPPPIDPAQVALQSAQAETARRAEADKTQSALAAAKLQQQSQADSEKNAIMADRNRITEQNAEIAAQTRLHQTAIESQSAQDIALLNISAGHPSHFRDGSSLG